MRYRIGLLCILSSVTLMSLDYPNYAKASIQAISNSIGNEESMYLPDVIKDDLIEDEMTVSEVVYGKPHPADDKSVINDVYGKPKSAPMSFRYSNNGLNFGSIAMKDESAQATTTLYIEKTGIHEAVLSFELSDFISDPLPDPTNDALMRAAFTNKVCRIAKVLIMKEGQPSDDLTITPTSGPNFIISVPSVSEGIYQIYVTIDLAIPKTAIVHDLFGEKSKYETGLQIGLPAASYTSDVLLRSLSDPLPEETGLTSVSNIIQPRGDE